MIVDKHDTTMWQLIVKKGMPPTRMVRYCCDELKEGGGRGRVMVTGVRWAESTKRKHNRGLLELNNYTSKFVKLMNDNDEARRMFETCAMKSMHTLNPIIDWTQEEVWEYLHSRNIPYCKLYDEGFDRIGCIGCPLAGSQQMRFEFARYPKYKQAYLRAFEKMLAVRKDNGKPYQQWHTAEDVMEWWLDEKRHPKVDADQLSLFSDVENPDAA